MRTALLVIDMQEASFTPRSVRHDTAGVVDRINSLAARVRANGGAVIFVQHAGPEGDAHHPNASGHKLLTELRVEDGDRLVEKRSCDAFLNTSMEAILKEMRNGFLCGYNRELSAGERLRDNRAFRWAHHRKSSTFVGGQNHRPP